MFHLMAPPTSHSGICSVPPTTALLLVLAARPGEEDGKALEMAFSKKKVDERKQWLQVR